MTHRNGLREWQSYRLPRQTIITSNHHKDYLVFDHLAMNECQIYWNSSAVIYQYNVIVFSICMTISICYNNSQQVCYSCVLGSIINMHIYHLTQPSTTPKHACLDNILLRPVYWQRITIHKILMKPGWSKVLVSPLSCITHCSSTSVYSSSQQEHRQRNWSGWSSYGQTIFFNQLGTIHIHLL